MLDRDQLETFAIVAEERSFERAAHVLNITRGAASQRVKALEDRAHAASSALLAQEMAMSGGVASFSIVPVRN